MIIDLRCSDRLRDLDLTPLLASLAEAVKQGRIDVDRARVVCDWVQYRANFRNPVDVREIMPSALRACDSSQEIAVDLRRVNSLALESEPRQYLEDWCRGSDSRIWDFNKLYWQALGLWEQVTGRMYEQALPGGETDARSTAAARELLGELFGVWDHLSALGALPEDLHVLELGVGNGNQARVWLDEFVKMDRERGTEYYRRLHYLMGDYSPHVLERARAAVSHHGDRVSTLVLDARAPTKTLGFLRFKAFLVYISNVYDNLPTDEIVRIGGRLYRVEVRAYVPQTEAAPPGGDPAALPGLVDRLLELGPELLASASPDRFPGGPPDAVQFWQKTWDAMRLEERYVPMEGLDLYEVAPGAGGETLRPIVEANGDVRMHASNGAAASFIDSLTLLHPFGMLQCHDLFVTDIEQYRSQFRGPGKYDSSVVNWVNGPLLAAIGRRNGFDVEFRPFAYREGSNITTMTAHVRE